MKAEYRPEDASKLFITRKTPAKCQPSSLQRTSNGEYTILKINSLHFDTMICITIAWFYALKVKWMGKIVSAFSHTKERTNNNGLLAVKELTNCRAILWKSGKLLWSCWKIWCLVAKRANDITFDFSSDY